jgi:TonB-dependent receptor
MVVMSALGHLALAQDAQAPQPVQPTAPQQPAPAATPPAPQPVVESDQQLEQIVVSGIRESIRDSINEKRNSDTIGDMISTKEIGQVPDVTIAEELNRLPGVDTTRDRGNASQASVRGMGPRLVLGLVNGREVASSEPSQELRWEIYPSEVLGGVKMYKTQDAEIVPGGISATIDIRTLAPLDGKDGFSVRFGPEYNSIAKDLPDYSPWGYRGSAGWIKHVNSDFAFALAASTQREKNGFPDFRTFGWNTVDTGEPGTLGTGHTVNTTWGLVTEVKEITQTRNALTGTFGWHAADGITIKGDALYSEYEIFENQFQTWYGNNITGNWANGNSSNYNSPGSTFQVVNGSVVGADLVDQYANYQSEINRYDEKHKLFATGLNGTWDIGDWTHEADLSLSTARRDNQWRAIYLDTLYPYPSNLIFNVGDGQTPYAAMTGVDPANPASQSIGGSNYREGQSQGPEKTQDRIEALALSTTRNLHDSLLTDFKLGARFSDREKDHSNNLWYYCPGVGSTTGACTPHSVSLSGAGLSQFTAPGFTAPPLVYGNFDSLFALAYPNSAQPANSNVPLQQTTVTERQLDEFGKLDFKTTLGDRQLTGNLGVRVTSVDTESNGFQSTNGTTVTPVSISNHYTDVLPSLNATYFITKENLLRFAAGIGIARPPLDALATGFTVNPTATPKTGGGGNPTLMPYKADMIDFSFESYFHEESLFAIAPFYKRLKTTISAGQSVENIAGTNYIVTGESNQPGGYIAGVELQLQTRFFFLPGALRDFGVYTNYAYVNSNVHESAPASNPYPMVGLARGTSEFDLFYSKDGFESRVAVKHHTEMTVAPTWVGTTLKGLAPETTVDASVSYEWSKQWIVRLQGHNLTNEPARFTTDNNTQDLANDAGYQVYGRTYVLDVGFKF